MNLHKKRYTSKLIGTSMLFLTIVLFIWAMLFYSNSKKMVEESFRKLATNTALTLSSVIETSADHYRNLLETHDTQSDFYKKIHAVFSDVINNSDVEYAYTVERIDENQIRYIIVGESTDHQEILTPIGTTWETGDYANEAFNKRKVVVTGFDYYPGWNETYMCVYAPIIDPINNEMLGLVGIDIQVDELIGQLNYLRNSAIITMCIMLLIVYIVFLAFSDRLVKLYIIDGLTGVYNRKFCDEYIKYLFEKVKKKKIQVSMLIIDIDHFKKVNDTYGHPFGDVVLKKLSETIMKCIDKKDCFARYGGEEFVILLEGRDEAFSIRFAEKLKEIVGDLEIMNSNIQEAIKITLSIGVACTNESNLKTANELVEMSDKALYMAKINRNSVVAYSEVIGSKN